jgi:hypothetical protein
MAMVAGTCFAEAQSERWGEANDGLRCRWRTASLRMEHAYAPVLALEIENVSDQAIEWEHSGCGITIDEPPIKGAALTFGDVVIPGRDARVMTEREVGETFHTGRPDVSPDAPFEGYYRLEPGGRLTLILSVPWSFRDKLTEGEHKIYAFAFRRNPFHGSDRMRNEIACEPLIVQVH